MGETEAKLMADSQTVMFCYWDDTVILINEFNTCMLVCGKQIVFAF